MLTCSVMAVLQKAKKAQREKQQKAAAKAAELGLEGPPKKIPKVKLLDQYIYSGKMEE